MKQPYHGIWPALLTPLDPAGKPDLGKVERLIDLFIQQGLDGVYVLGSTGQWPLLTIEQRRSVAERVVKAAAGKLPVMVHVGAVATEDAVDLAKHAAKIGADAISAVTPIYYPPSPDVLFEHYRRIGAAADLPLFVYHLYVVNQTALDPRDYAERLLALPHIAGMKITDRDLYTFGLIHSFTSGKLRIFSGADEVMCQAALSGAVGAIGTFYNLWGPACQKARREFVAGSFDTGRRFMLALQSTIAQVFRAQSTWSFLRSAMRIKYGIDIGMPKPPLAVAEKAWDDAQVERLVAAVDEAAG